MHMPSLKKNQRHTKKHIYESKSLWCEVNERKTAIPFLLSKLNPIFKQ